MATNGQFYWPPVGNSVAAYGQFFMAANTSTPCQLYALSCTFGSPVRATSYSAEQRSPVSASNPSDAMRPSAATTLVESLRAEIRAGDLLGGELITEEEIATKFNMSRTPAREAIARLAAEGLLLKRKNGTVTVFRPSLADLHEIYEIRLLLEPMAAKFAAERATPEDIPNLDHLWNELEEMEPGPDWSLTHEAFHMAIYGLSHRTRLLKTISTLRMQSEPYIRMGIQIDANLMQRGQQDHRSMIAAIRDNDATRAKRVTEAHLKATLRTLPRIFGMR